MPIIQIKLTQIHIDNFSAMLSNPLEVQSIHFTLPRYRLLTCILGGDTGLLLDEEGVCQEEPPGDPMLGTRPPEIDPFFLVFRRIKESTTYNN